MNWTDILVALAAKSEPLPSERADAAPPASLVLEGAPPVRVYRQPRRPNSYATPHGNGAYDPSGGLLLSATDRYPDAIYVDSAFLTCVSCTVHLPAAHTLSLKPAPLAGLKSFFKKPAQYQVSWAVKTDFPAETQDKILTFLNTQNQACLKHIAIELVPAEKGGHSLIVSTSLLPDNLNNFCLVKDFHPLQREGKPASDLDTACFLVESMIRCCRTLCGILEERCNAGRCHSERSEES